MKKFLVPLFFALLLSCSSKGFESDIAASAQKEVDCFDAAGEYEKINQNLCEEIGGSTTRPPSVEVSSSSYEELSSSSDEEFSSSSEEETGSSSSRARSSSSSRPNSSSSSIAVSGSSSSNSISSSSSIEASSSSDEEIGSSSSVETSSSSVVISISSSSSGDLGPAKLSGCSTTSFPYYVARGATNQEDLTNLISLEGNPYGCSVTYTLTSGSSYANISSGSSFITFTASASSTARSLTIQASLACEEGIPVITPLTRPCPITVVIAERFKKIETCPEPNNPRTQIGTGTTTVEITCLKNDGNPAENFGCDCPGKDTPTETSWNATNVFKINGVNAQQWGGCWADAPIPAADAAKAIKRVLIESNTNREVGCVAH